MSSTNSVITTFVLLIAAFSTNAVLAQRTAAERMEVAAEYARLKEQIKELKLKFDEDKRYSSLEKLLGKKIAALTELRNLNATQVKHLELAARGAVESLVAELRKQETNGVDLPAWADGIEEVVCRSGDIIFLGRSPQKQIVLYHPIWVNAVDGLVTDEERAEDEERMKFQRQVLVDQFVLRLDEQVKLSAAQRAKARIRLTDVATKILKDIRYTSTDYLGMPLEGCFQELTDDQLKDLLTDQQLEKWQTFLDPNQ